MNRAWIYSRNDKKLSQMLTGVLDGCLCCEVMILVCLVVTVSIVNILFLRYQETSGQTLIWSSKVPKDSQWSGRFPNEDSIHFCYSINFKEHESSSWAVGSLTQEPRWQCWEEWARLSNKGWHLLRACQPEGAECLHCHPQGDIQ